MSICAIIPVNLMQSANDSLEQQGFGAGNFSVPLYANGGATYGGCHAWNDAVFVPALKAVTGVIWEESDGDPTTRFNALVEAQGVKWGANAPQYPTSGMVLAGQMYRYTDQTLWSVIQPFNTGVYNAHPSTYPALIRQVREPGQVYEWKQPIDQFDSYRLKNLFTGKPDQAKRNGKTYKTLIDFNVWEPGAVGSESLWAEVI